MKFDSLSVDEDVHHAVIDLLVTFVSVLLEATKRQQCFRLDRDRLERLVFSPHIDYLSIYFSYCSKFHLTTSSMMSLTAVMPITRTRGKAVVNQEREEICGIT